MTTKTYIISEETLRQVLSVQNSLRNALWDSGTHDEMAGETLQCISTLRTILASPPKEPVAWFDPEIGIADANKCFDTDIPLYAKDDQ